MQFKTLFIRVNFLCLLFCLIGMKSFSQTDKKKLKESMLSYVADSACNCIRSLEVANKSYALVNDGINECIYQQLYFYRLCCVLIDKDLFEVYMNDTTFNADPYLKMDDPFKELIDYYYEIKRDLLEHCVSMKAKSYSKDQIHPHSVTTNKKALKWYNEAVELEQQNKNEASIALLQKALKKDSLFAFAWDNLGLNYRKIGDYDRAIMAYEHSIAVDPRGKMPWQNMAIVYERKKDYQGALICYKKLGELDMVNPEVYYGIGRIYAIYLNEYEYALENMCMAFSLYKEINAPEIEDAKTIINIIHEGMTKEGEEEKFNKILMKHFPAKQ